MRPQGVRFGEGARMTLPVIVQLTGVARASKTAPASPLAPYKEKRL
jgi:hypothetical protein